MKNMYRVVPDSKGLEQLRIHPATAAKLGIMGKEKVNVCFGVKTCELEVLETERVALGEIAIAKPVVQEWRIPLSPRYELRYVNEVLHIGPYIGIMVTTSKRSLHYKVSSLTTFLRHYELIGGAVLAFSLEGVNQEKTTIDGYLFNPQTQKWQRGIFTYPASMFSILEASLTRDWEDFQAISQHFHSVLGDHMFNYPLFHKWEMYEWLHQTPLQKYLPDTILYQQPDDIYQMLDKHGRVHLKPIWGRLGLGVMEARWKQKGVSIKYRKKHQNHSVLLKNQKEAERFFQQVLIPQQFIIQESINLLSKNKRIIDFRLMMVKNQHGLWENVGFFARYGAKNSIISNISADGIAESGRKTLKKLLNLSNSEALQWKQQMIDVAIEVASIIESRGIHCGNLGLDIAVDTDRRMWILEINNQNPDHYIAVRAGRKAEFLQARTANMLYAKKLAGFQ